jgi:hypothetical protein
VVELPTKLWLLSIRLELKHKGKKERTNMRKNVNRASSCRQQENQKECLRAWGREYQSDKKIAHRL